MISTVGFSEDEKDSVLMKKNFGFIKHDLDAMEKLRERSQHWLKETQNNEKFAICSQLDSVQEPDRILFADAERTFSSPQNRQKLVQVTSHLAQKLGDYQQNLTFIVSFLLLFFSPGETVAIFGKVAKDYLPGHFKAVATGSKVDLLLLIRLAKNDERTSKVVERLEKEGVPPDFIKKWFSGLCVHTMPLRFVFDYFDDFMSSGFLACLRFGLSALHVLASRVDESKDLEEIMRVLELQISSFPSQKEYFETCEAIVQAAKEIDWNLDTIDLDGQREDIFETQVKPLLAQAELYAAENPVEDIQSCAVCLDGFEELHCIDCGLFVCEECHENPPRDASHRSHHRVESLEDDGDQE